jgi:hypothetical protein
MVAAVITIVIAIPRRIAEYAKNVSPVGQGWFQSKKLSTSHAIIPVAYSIPFLTTKAKTVSTKVITVNIAKAMITSYGVVVVLAGIEASKAQTPPTLIDTFLLPSLPVHATSNIFGFIISVTAAFVPYCFIKLICRLFSSVVDGFFGSTLTKL